MFQTRVLVLIAVAGLFGAAVGPPLAQAAGSLVTITDPSGEDEAQVYSDGELAVEPGSVANYPGGGVLLLSGTVGKFKLGNGVITSVNIANMSANPQAAASLIVGDSRRELLVEHVDFSESVTIPLPGGIYFEGRIRAEVVGQGLRYFIHGYRYQGSGRGPVPIP